MVASKKHRTHGVTLLEVILALALSVLVFAAIAAAIRVNLVGLTHQQIRIERKQIARAALMMIANDCRAGLQYKAADFSGLENLLTSQNMMLSGGMEQMAGGGSDSEGGEGESGGGSGGGNSGGGGGSQGSSGSGGSGSGGGAGGGGSSGSGSSGTGGSDDSESSDVYDESLVSFRPTFVGTPNSLILDVSRIPRLDQYNPMIASAASLAQTPADIKSIAYFFSDTDGGVRSEIQFTSAAPGGLYRREIDRAVAAYAGDPQAIGAPDNFAKLVSPEVAEVSFSYFDGSEWRSSWDSNADGGFPLAIEVILIIDPARTAHNNLTYSYRGFDQQSMEQFRTVVHLPMSEPAGE